MVLEVERKKKKEGIAVNLTGMKFICFSHFFYALLCLCCLRTRVRSLGTVCVGSQSFGVGFVLRLFFFWILDSLRKVMTNFESLYQPDELVGKPDQPVHRIQFVGTTVLSLAPFVSVLSIRSRICNPFVFFGFLTL